MRLDDSGDRARAQRLRRMRSAATGVLVVLALVFVISSLLARRFGWLAYVRAFAEAGMVGGCADWFAVTALFRRPLGLPIPHTGLVPREKDRIGAALGDFIADNFLTAEVLDARLRQLEVGRWGAAWLREPENAQRLAGRITELLQDLLDQSTPQARREFLAAVLKDVALVIPAAPAASKVLRVLWAEGRAQLLIDKALDMAVNSIGSHEADIRDQVAQRSFRWLPRWVDRKIADQVLKALADLLKEMRAHDHPWREQASEWVEGFIDRLEHDPELSALAERLKADVLAHPLVAEHLDHILADLEARYGPGGGADPQVLSLTLARALNGLGQWLDQNPAARDIFNTWARLAAQRVIAPRRKGIGAFIAEIVAGWDTQSLVEKLELQVGRDLQYIRINGAVVGGLVGLLIFVAARALKL